MFLRQIIQVMLAAFSLCIMCEGLLCSQAFAQEKQQKIGEKKLLARARALAGTAKPAKVSLKVDYTLADDNILSISLPEHLGGGTKTTTLSGKFSLLFTFEKDPNIATVSVVESDEKISSIPFVYKGVTVESGDILFGLKDFDQKATRGVANFKTGKFQMTYLLSPKVPFLSQEGIPLPDPKGQMLNEERGTINPKTFEFKTDTKISIKSGPFTGVEISGDERGHRVEPREPACRRGSITVPSTAANCGEYMGAVALSGPICNMGICNYSDKFSIIVIRGTKSLRIGPKSCSAAFNDMDVHGDWYVAIDAPGALCGSFPPSLSLQVDFVH